MNLLFTDSVLETVRYMICYKMLSYCRISRMTKKKQQIMQKGMVVWFSCYFCDYMKIDYCSMPNRLVSSYISLLDTTLTCNVAVIFFKKKTSDVTKNIILKVLDSGLVWIDLFELIYCHKYLWNYLQEFMETAYDMSISCFAAYFHKFSGIVMKTFYSLYQTNLTILSLL